MNVFAHVVFRHAADVKITEDTDGGLRIQVKSAVGEHVTIDINKVSEFKIIPANLPSKLAKAGEAK